MKKRQISISINEEDFEAVTNIYKNMGLNVKVAIHVFIKMSIIKKGFPFSLNYEPTDSYFDTELEVDDL